MSPKFDFKLSVNSMPFKGEILISEPILSSKHESNLTCNPKIICFDNLFNFPSQNFTYLGICKVGVKYKIKTCTTFSHSVTQIDGLLNTFSFENRKLVAHPSFFFGERREGGKYIPQEWKRFFRSLRVTKSPPTGIVRGLPSARGQRKDLALFKDSRLPRIDSTWLQKNR